MRKDFEQSIHQDLRPVIVLVTTIIQQEDSGAGRSRRSESSDLFDACLRGRLALPQLTLFLS